MNHVEEKCIVKRTGCVEGFCFCFLFSPSSVRPVAPFPPPGLRVQFGIACPGRRHGGGRGVGSIVHEAQVLVVAHGLAKLAEDVIVYVSRIAAALKKSARMSETSDAILSWKQIGAHR